MAMGGDEGYRTKWREQEQEPHQSGRAGCVIAAAALCSECCAICSHEAFPNREDALKRMQRNVPAAKKGQRVNKKEVAQNSVENKYKSFVVMRH